jgi:hypothetical protein
MSLTSAATSEAIQNLEFEAVAHSPCSPDLAQSDFWLFAALKKHLKGIYFACDEEIPAATEKWFRRQPEEFFSDGFLNCSALAALYRTSGELHGNLRYGNKVYILSYCVLFCISMLCVGVKIPTWGRYFVED